MIEGMDVDDIEDEEDENIAEFDLIQQLNNMSLSEAANSSSDRSEPELRASTKLLSQANPVFRFETISSKVDN